MRKLLVLILALHAPVALGCTCAQMLAGLCRPGAITVELEERRDGVALYRVTGDTMPPSYAETVGTLLDQVTRTQPSAPVYFDLSKLPENRRAAFRETVKIANEARDNPLRVRHVRNIDGLFDPNARRETFVDRDSGTRTYGAQKGKEYASADVTVEGSKYRITILSRVATAAKEFLSRLRSYFQGGSRARGQSTIEVINQIRNQIMQEYHLDADDLRIELKNQLGETQIIEARHVDEHRG